ncbi:sigma-70 family RNA polymerase sigma factor [Candidatus Cyanaurora vandensis]|uniref:sigma-70 family RNA polymerase sigma factor n=1 Tax=Candidatus Cyanaurora vandensis TaxID=2714958 RepID=UPI00257BCF48|nr:sigma-70 family RNA polymerase sigma factor [Candidatus Cyanaurora vandensis]
MHARERLSDQELFRGLKTGRLADLSLLYARYYPQVLRVAQQILGNPLDAEDLTQEVFLILWQGNYDPGRGTLGGYLNLVTRSRAIDRLRTRSTARRVLTKWQSSTPSETNHPLEQLVAQEDCCTVRLALTRLPQRQRQVLELAYYGGLSQSKIATAIHTPLGTVKCWMRQGLGTLRQHLQQVS